MQCTTQWFYASSTKDVIFYVWNLQIFSLLSLVNPEYALLYVYTLLSSSCLYICPQEWAEQTSCFHVVCVSLHPYFLPSLLAMTVSWSPSRKRRVKKENRRQLSFTLCCSYCCFSFQLIFGNPGVSSFPRFMVNG